MKFSIKDLFRKCDQIRSFRSYLNLMENFIFLCSESSATNRSQKMAKVN